MSKTVDGKTYLSTQETISTLDLSKQSFYSNAKNRLRTYHFDAKRTPWYAQEEVFALKNGKVLRKANIAITGIFGDWTSHLQSLGYSAETQNRAVAVVQLPEDAIALFHLPSDQLFFKRSRVTFANGVPICTWDTYYPVHLIDGIRDQLMHGVSLDVVKYIREHHSIAIEWTKDRYAARMTSFDEQNLFQLLTDEPILTLQRASYTADKSTVVLYSDMTLLGSWFTVEREYPVTTWL